MTRMINAVIVRIRVETVDSYELTEITTPKDLHAFVTDVEFCMQCCGLVLGVSLAISLQ